MSAPRRENDGPSPGGGEPPPGFLLPTCLRADDETVTYLGRTAARLGMPKSQVVREAIRVYGEHVSRLTDEERVRLLAVFDRVAPGIPTRPRAEVEAELSEVRRARRGGPRSGGTP